MNFITKNFWGILIYFVFISACFFGIASAEKPASVLILPFNVHSDQDLSFLRTGIEDMLYSRLSMESKLIPLNRKKTRQALKDLPGLVSDETAVVLAGKLQADYVLLGSLTVFGETVSTDARLIDVQTKLPLVVFHKFGENRGEVVRHIDLFTLQIEDKLFGRRDDTARPSIESEKKASLWRSQNFEVEIIGLSVGDVDGDHRKETVFISENRIYVYRYADGRFESIGEISGQQTDKFIGVDVADINNNGKAEIFITNVQTRLDRVRSFVLEWNGSTFIRIKDNIIFYFRVLNIPGQGKVLMGQKRGIDKIFASVAFELQWLGDEYKPVKEHVLPKHINIYGLALGDVKNNGQKMILAYTLSDYLMLLDKSGREEWKSGKPGGGSATYLEVRKDSDSSIGNVKEMTRIYLHQRIHIADIDNDGKTDMIVVNNHDKARRLLGRTRLFSYGLIECLAWDSFGLSQKWKTRELDGYLSDSAIGDFNNDGQNEILVSVVAEKGSSFGKPKSFIVSWDLALIGEPQ